MRKLIYNLLRKSERYTKTDMVYLAKGGFWLNTAQLFSSASAFLLAIVFANLLPQETFGIYKYVISIFSLLSISTLTGIDTAITRAVAKGYEGGLLKSLITKIKWGVLGFLGSLTFAGYYYINGNTKLALAFTVVSIFVPFFNSFDIYNSFYTGKKNFKKVSILNLSVKLVSLLVITSTLLLTDNLLAILISFLAPLVILKGFYVIKILRTYKKTDSGDHTISLGKHLSLINLLSTIANEIDRVLVFTLLGSAELAVYYFAQAPINQVKSFLKTISALALPKLSERTEKEIQQSIIRKMWRFAAGITVLVAAFFLLADLAYNIFFPQYLESIPFAKIFALSLIPLANLLPYTALQSMGAKKELYKFHVFSSLFLIVSSFVGLITYGLMGLVIARVAARYASFIFISLQFKFLKANSQKS